MHRENLRKVTDIAERLDWYIGQLWLHKEDQDYARGMADELVGYIREYFSVLDKTDRNVLKSLEFAVIGDLYKYSSRVTLVDEWSDLFQEQVVREIFDQLHKLNVHGLFVLDNTMNEGRQAAFKRIFSNVGFEILSEPEQTSAPVEGIKAQLRPDKNALLLIEREWNEESLTELFDFLKKYADDDHLCLFKCSGYSDTKYHTWGIRMGQARDNEYDEGAENMAKEFEEQEPSSKPFSFITFRGGIDDRTSEADGKAFQFFGGENGDEGASGARQDTDDQKSPAKAEEIIPALRSVKYQSETEVPKEEFKRIYFEHLGGGYTEDYWEKFFEHETGHKYFVREPGSPKEDSMMISSGQSEHRLFFLTEGAVESFFDFPGKDDPQ